jgi:hypothetical protein
MAEGSIDPEVDRRVSASLKEAIDRNLAREAALGDLVSKLPNVGFFSRGVVFSKSGNGTPFSRGIIFSKSGRVEIPPDDENIIREIGGLEQVAFEAFTGRLLALKQIKDIGGPAARP